MNTRISWLGAALLMVATCASPRSNRNGDGGGDATAGSGGGGAGGGTAGTGGGGSGGGGSGGTGGGGAGGGGTGGVEPCNPVNNGSTKQPTWADVRSLLAVQGGCATMGSCHDSMNGDEPGTFFYMARVQTDQELYDVLMQDMAGPECGGMGKRIVPGNVDQSILLTKIDTRVAPACGDRMPRGVPYCTQAIPLADVEVIRTWITNGAPGPGADAGVD